MTSPRAATPLSTRVAEWLERSGLAARLEGLGPLSPLLTLATFAPGAQLLLAAAERDAERGLHLARGLFLVGLGLAGVWALGPAVLLANAPVWALFGVPLAALALWFLVWRELGRAAPSPWLRYALVVVDALMALRVLALARSPLPRVPSLLPESDVAAVAGPLLLYVAVSGAFRLDPRLAAFSTFCALGGYAVVAASLALPTRQALLVGAAIWTAGFVGAQAARVFRYIALKAGEQAVLERYVPEALTRELARTGDPTGEGTECEVTVLIVDVRGYTQRTERLTPRAAVAFLNEYFAIVVAQLAAEGAVLDKYVGDGVFSFFQGEQHAARALRAARAIVAAVERSNADRAGEPLRIGVAVHTGPALVGTIGSHHKREYTVIADTVNVAARLEELNKSFGSAIVVSDQALRAAGAGPNGLVGPNTVELRGHAAPLSVHYLPVPA